MFLVETTQDQNIGKIIYQLLSFPFLLDALIIILLVISVVIGVKRGLFRSICRSIFVVGMLILSWFVFVPLLGNWINESAMKAFNITTTISYGSTTVTATSLKEIYQALADIANSNPNIEFVYSTEWISGLSLGVAYAIAWLTILLILLFFSWIISCILWAFPVRYIFPHRSKKKRKSRINVIGGLLNIVSCFIIVMMMMSSSRALCPGFASLSGLLDSTDVALFSPYTIGILGGLSPDNLWAFGWASHTDAMF